MLFSFEEAARSIRDLGRVLQREMLRAMDESLADLRETALEFSSGTLTPADLARMDHPFARRHGHPLIPPEQINVLTGTFRSSWQAEGPHHSGALWIAAVYNTDPKAARYLEPGTRLMFARPIADAAAAESGPRFELRMARAIQVVSSG